MTTGVCAIDSAPPDTGESGATAGAGTAVRVGADAVPAGCVFAADGSYAARLTREGPSWYPERWTFGPEPYAVALAGNQPEEPGTEVLPLADGQVLIHRTPAGLHTFSLLYPTGPATGPATGRQTGERPLGSVECDALSLLPAAPDGATAYALAPGEASTAVWRVAGGAFGPEHVAEVPGFCAGGAWLDTSGRLLALDQERDGVTKTVVVDLDRGGETTPLLQIAERSNDRLLLADPESGLLLVRSDAAGEDRIGWGVLGSMLPVRFPRCLRAPDLLLTPFAVQPGQLLTPEACAVALRMDGPGGTGIGLWRPTSRHVVGLTPPEGWLAGAGRWTRAGVLRLPYATRNVPCGVADVPFPASASEPVEDLALEEPEAESPPAARPVPLREAPLTGRAVVG